MSSRVRIRIWIALILLLLSPYAYRFVWRTLSTWTHQTQTPSQPTVIVVVLDTVRADHLSACGYEQPTSPTLERLVRDGAQLRCDGVSAGAWTLPSHASMFTGLGVHEHGADHASYAEGVDVFGHGELVRPLADEYVTLAERFSERGYQTAAVSANVVVSSLTGLMQGFDHADSTPLEQWRGEELVGHVYTALSDVKTDGTPLFLFVNIIDAHQPYWLIPPWVGWLPFQTEVSYFATNGPEDTWASYVSGSLDQASEEALRAKVTNGYDYGIYSADWTLNRVLKAIEAHGWMEDYRLIVVSDHGEFLGEHQLLDHGVMLYEPLTKVPLLIGGTQPIPTLPPRVPTQEVFSLALDGQLAGDPSVSTSQPSQFWHDFSGGQVPLSPNTAIWRGDDKEMRVGEETRRFDLLSDPGELNGVVTPPSDELKALHDAATMRASESVDVDEAALEALKKMGYLAD